jgi:hypothetical protein
MTVRKLTGTTEQVAKHGNQCRILPRLGPRPYSKILGRRVRGTLTTSRFRFQNTPMMDLDRPGYLSGQTGHPMNKPQAEPKKPPRRHKRRPVYASKVW